MKKLANNILTLPSIKRMRTIIKHCKVPEAEYSTMVIIEELANRSEQSNKKRFSFAVWTYLQAVRCLKMRFYHCPAQYCLGQWYFRRLTIRIAPPLLIPRFQTQHFVTLIIEEINKKWPKGSTLKIVDFCCGTGVIGLSILKQLSQEYNLSCIFIDIHHKAIQYTRINAEINQIPFNQLEMIQGNMLDYLHLISKSQVVLANPPYIGIKQYSRLQKQVKLYQDREALLSGTDGMFLIKPLIQTALREEIRRQDLLMGIQFGGQSVEEWAIQDRVVLDQYNKRRYLIL